MWKSEKGGTAWKVERREKVWNGVKKVERVKTKKNKERK